MSGLTTSPLKVAILAASNLDLLASPLSRALGEKAIPASIWTAGFNQYRQAIFDPSSGLYSQDEAILFLDAPDLFPQLFGLPLGVTVDSAEEHANGVIREIGDLVQTLTGRMPGTTVYLNTICHDGVNALYGLEYNSALGQRRVIAAYNVALGNLARTNPSLVVVDVEAIAYSMGLERWFDRRLWHLARIRYSREAISRLAIEYANVISARRGLARKCIVLDLDNTLWGGIIGEDGVAGIQLGHEGSGLAFTEFQHELLTLSRRGILIALCSKNNYSDALEAIRQHPAMLLREEQFAAVRINWKEKAENLGEIANELNLGLDSLVFLDDNPVERAQVRAALPEVCVPEWPEDPSEYVPALYSVLRAQLLRLQITEEDRSRAEMYRADVNRRAVLKSGADLESFYKSLDMKMTVGRAEPNVIPRIAQLTQKTNQFNLTTRRYTEAEIAQLSRSVDSRVYWMDLADKFGPNGIVGVLIANELKAGTWKIDTFLMSCRVIGRNVEQAFFATVAEEFAEAGVTQLIGEYIPTQKNALVVDLYARLGFSAEPSSDLTRTLWRLKLSQSTPPVPEWFEINIATRTTA